MILKIGPKTTRKRFKKTKKYQKINEKITSAHLPKCVFDLKTKREKALEMSLRPFYTFGTSIWKWYLVVSFKNGTYTEIRYCVYDFIIRFMTYSV